MEEGKSNLLTEIATASPALPSTEKVEQLTLNICEALEGFSSGPAGTPHMNIKPSNILLIETDPAASKAAYKLCDS